MNGQNSNKNIINDISIKDKNDFTNKIIFGKYQIIKKIGEGSQSSIYSGENVETKEKVAIKMEKQKEKDCLLKNEIYLLYRFKNNEGIVNIITCGRCWGNFVLIENLLGKSLHNIFLDLSKKFTLLDICQIAIQCLDRLELIHTKGIIHCDIKPDNFVIGLKDPNVIYLIDFGLAHNYKSLKTGKHIDFSFTGYMTGTARYASRNALRGKQLSRRDDVESFIYMILYFISKKLPWMNIRAKTLGEKYKKIYKYKIEFNYRDFCKKYPQEIITCLEYILNLSFKEKPNYEYMRQLFKKILEQQKLYINNYFSWMNNMKEFEIKRRRPHSETKGKVIERNKKHSSNLKISIHENLKESTIAMTNLKLSKILINESIKIRESQATVYENNEENNINNDNINFDDVLNKKEEDEYNNSKEEENNEEEVKEEEIRDDEEKTDNNNNNLFSTGAKNKQQLEKYPDDEQEKKYELKKELEVIKEEDEEYDEDIENRSKKRGGSELVYIIDIDQYNFGKKKNGSKYRENLKKKDEKIKIHSKLIELEDKKDDINIINDISNIPVSQNIDKNENEIINNEIKEKNDNIIIIEKSKNEIPQKEEEKEEENKKKENIKIKKEILENKTEKSFGQKETKEETKEKEIIEDVKNNSLKNEIYNIKNKNENKIIDNNENNNIIRSLTNNEIKTISRKSKTQNEIYLSPQKKRYTDDKIKYSSIGSEGYLNYMKNGNALTQRDNKKKRGKGQIENGKNKKDNCIIF